MATREEAVRAVLTGDATLMALATGGVHDGDTLGRRGLTIEDLSVDDQVAIQPGIKITWSTENPYGVAQAVLQSERIFFQVYFYQDGDDGYSIVRSMRRRVKTLLTYQPVQYDDPADDWMCNILWVGCLTELKDDELGGASMECSRYEMVTTPIGGS